LAVNTSKGTVRFAAFELNLRSGKLRKDGAKPVRLPEQPFRILAMLLEHVGEVVTQTGGFEAKESKDGNWLYYSKESEEGVWKMPIQGGTGTLVLNRRCRRYWDLTDQGICFMDVDATPHPTISFYNFDTQQVTRIGTLDKQPPIAGSGTLSVSPDGQWVLYPQVDHVESHIMLVENFR